MNELLVIALLLLCVMVGTGIIFILNYVIKIYNILTTKKEENEYKIDPVINDVMEYAIDKGLVCSIRMGLNNKSTLYHREDDAEYSVTELFTTDEPAGSASYEDILKELKSRVDVFIENKETIKKKVKEQHNAS